MNKNACLRQILLVRHILAAETVLLLLTIFGTIAIDIAIAKGPTKTIAIGIAIAKRPLRNIAIAIDCDFYYWPTLLQSNVACSGYHYTTQFW